MKKIDKGLFFIILSIVFAGILILTSVSSVYSQQKFGNSTHYLLHQILFGIIPGLLMGFFLLKIDLLILKKYSWILILSTLVLMALVFIPKVGIVSGGANRWLNLGFSTFQPSEMLKLFFIIYLSTLLAKRGEKKDWKMNFLPFLIIIFIIVILLHFQSNLSTLLVILSTGGLIYFASETPLWHSFLMISGGGLLAYIFIITKTYRMQRVSVLLNPLKDPMGLGYQLKQSLIAVGSGGIFGLGIGMSNQKFGFLPQTMSDSVFAIYAEELGFLGAIVLLSLFLIFLLKGIKIAKETNDNFSKLFVIGFVSWISIQAFINIGAMIGLVPLTGIPLPFISYGGSHIAIELAGVGILLNISKSIKK